MSLRNMSLKAAVIAAAGLLAMNGRARTAEAAVALDPGCIRGCCFCDDFGTCDDFYCYSRGCSAFVECSPSDARCGGNTQLIECIP
jgi:hypothetical protein